MRGRWDHLYEAKAVPLAEHFVEEVAKLVAKDLGGWPLTVEEWTSPQDQARFGPLLSADAPRPEPKLWTEGIRLARLDLMREYDQLDDYWRNERWRACAVPGAGSDFILFLSLYLTEQMLAIAEATEGRIKRPQLVDLLTRAERRLHQSPLVLPS